MLHWLITLNYIIWACSVKKKEKKERKKEKKKKTLGVELFISYKSPFEAHGILFSNAICICNYYMSVSKHAQKHTMYFQNYL